MPKDPESAKDKLTSWFVYTRRLTCDSGTNGGPEAMSTAFVPGLILRVDPSSVSGNGAKSCSPALSPTVGDLGPIWTSVNGGGLGRRGELDGDTPAAAILLTNLVAGALRQYPGVDDWNRGANAGKRGWSRSISTSASEMSSRSPPGASKRHQSILSPKPYILPYLGLTVGPPRRIHTNTSLSTPRSI
jgi:hypothetical protein